MTKNQSNSITQKELFNEINKHLYWMLLVLRNIPTLNLNQLSHVIRDTPFTNKCTLHTTLLKMWKHLNEQDYLIGKVNLENLNGVQDKESPFPQYNLYLTPKGRKHLEKLIQDIDFRPHPYVNSKYLQNISQELPIKVPDSTNVLKDSSLKHNDFIAQIWLNCLKKSSSYSLFLYFHDLRDASNRKFKQHRDIWARPDLKGHRLILEAETSYASQNRVDRKLFYLLCYHKKDPIMAYKKYSDISVITRYDYPTSITKEDVTKTSFDNRCWITYNIVWVFESKDMMEKWFNKCVKFVNSFYNNPKYKKGQKVYNPRFSMTAFRNMRMAVIDDERLFKFKGKPNDNFTYCVDENPDFDSWLDFVVKLSSPDWVVEREERFLRELKQKIEDLEKQAKKNEQLEEEKAEQRRLAILKSINQNWIRTFGKKVRDYCFDHTYGTINSKWKLNVDENGLSPRHPSKELILQIIPLFGKLFKCDPCEISERTGLDVLREIESLLQECLPNKDFSEDIEELNSELNTIEQNFIERMKAINHKIEFRKKLIEIHKTGLLTEKGFSHFFIKGEINSGSGELQVDYLFAEDRALHPWDGFWVSCYERISYPISFLKKELKKSLNDSEIQNHNILFRKKSKIRKNDLSPEAQESDSEYSTIMYQNLLILILSGLFAFALNFYEILDSAPSMILMAFLAICSCLDGRLTFLLDPENLIRRTLFIGGLGFAMNFLYSKLGVIYIPDLGYGLAGCLGAALFGYIFLKRSFWGYGNALSFQAFCMPFWISYVYADVHLEQEVYKTEYTPIQYNQIKVGDQYWLDKEILWHQKSKKNQDLIQQDYHNNYATAVRASYATRLCPKGFRIPKVADYEALFSAGKSIEVKDHQNWQELLAQGEWVDYPDGKNLLGLGLYPRGFLDKKYVYGAGQLIRLWTRDHGKLGYVEITGNGYRFGTLDEKKGLKNPYYFVRCVEK